MDYCGIFQEALQSLYLLAFLLTANHARAEQCYAEALEDAINGNRVFKEWALSWSKLTVIKSSIQLVSKEVVETKIQIPGMDNVLMVKLSA
jgi:hypothetical protein